MRLYVKAKKKKKLLYKIKKSSNIGKLIFKKYNTKLFVKKILKK